MQEARTKAQEALKDIKEIGDLIQSATGKSQDLHQVLEGSEQNAIRARTIAQTAQLKANNASAMANETRQDANKTKAEVIKLGKEADKLQLRVNDTDNMIRQYEDKILQDADGTGQVGSF